MISSNKLKAKKCRHCKTMFTPYKSTQVVCSPKCAIEYTNAKIKKEAQKKHRADKKKFNEENTTLSQWKKKLQTVFNSYIRLRDIEKGCISCGTPLQNRKFDAGHFYPTTYEGLRFKETNVHGQCVPCNRNLHGNLHEYRKNITQRITDEELTWLDNNRYIKLKLTKYEIKDLITLYKGKIKNLRK